MTGKNGGPPGNDDGPRKGPDLASTDADVALREATLAAAGAPAGEVSPHGFTFDTSTLLPRQRLAAIGEAYAAAMMRCRIDPLFDDDDVWSRMAASRVGDLMILDYAGSPMRCVGEGMDAGATTDGVMVDLVLAGGYGIRQGRRETVVNEGEGVLYLSHMPFLAQSTAPVALFSKSVMIPGAMLAEVARDLEGLAGLHLDASLLEISLLPGYLAGVPMAGEAIDPTLAATVGRHVGELLVGAIARSLRREDPTEARGAKAARQARLMQLIEDNLASPTLSVVKVARMLGCTDRTVQKIMEENGTTFSELVMEKRLRNAHAALAASTGGRSIADIAYAAGFSDASHFTHAFRRRYGESPRQVRGTAVAPPANAAE